MSGSIIKFGKVAEINPDKNRVRVQLPDEDGILTDWLPVLQEDTKRSKSSRIFEIGTAVVVALDENGNAGICLGAYYPDGQSPPSTIEQVAIRIFGDGAEIGYDESAGAYIVKAANSILIEAAGKSIMIDNSGLTFQGNVSVKGNLTVSGSTDLKNTKINGITQTGN